MKLSCVNLLIIGCFVFLAGCGRSTPTQYYILECAGPALQYENAKNASLRVSMVNVPDYLNRNNIVSRVHGESRLILAEFHLWAEPLCNGIRRVAQEKLARLLVDEKISVIPNGSNAEADYALEIDIIRFDGNFAAPAVLEASWTLFDRDSSVLRSGVYARESSVEGKTYDILVGTESRLLHAMVEDIAPLIAEIINRQRNR